MRALGSSPRCVRACREKDGTRRSDHGLPDRVQLFEVAGSVFTFYLQKSIPPPVKHWISMSILVSLHSLWGISQGPRCRDGSTTHLTPHCFQKNGGRVDILKSNMIRLYSDSLTPQFVLVEPGTSEEVVLRTKWQLFAEQYSLNIVSWTYVSACVLSKGILPIRDFIDAVPIFSRMVEEPGEPLRVLLHKSVDKRNVPDLQLKITVCIFLCYQHLMSVTMMMAKLSMDCETARV